MIPNTNPLGYDATPGISVPLRFFISAPLFGVLAGLLLLVDPEGLASRWTPAALASTHLLAVGFMLMVMVGALFQILPVVCGIEVPVARLTATLVHVMLATGALSLALGLWWMSPPWLTSAAALLGGGLALFLGAVAIALLGTPLTAGSQRDMRLAMSGLGLAVLLGISLSLILANGLALPLGKILLLHIGWALLGGTGILIAATSWVVVPMFQITPSYPQWMIRRWAISCTVSLSVWSACVLFAPAWLEQVLLWWLAALAVAFLIATLRLLSQTRRSKPDASFQAFRFGVLCLLAGIACVLATQFSEAAQWRTLAGVLLLYGGTVSVIQGMLYKIVPFLAWLHLTQAGIKAPNVKKLLPEQHAKHQLTLHSLAVAAVIAAILIANPLLAKSAGLLVAVEFAWLAINMLRTMRIYRRTQHQGVRQNRPLKILKRA